MKQAKINKESKIKQITNKQKGIVKFIKYAWIIGIYFVVLSQLKYFVLTDIEQTGILFALMISLYKINKFQ